MKKIEDWRFLCIDFLNMDLSRAETLDSLVQIFFPPGKHLGLPLLVAISLRKDPLAAKKRLSRNVGNLIGFQQWMLTLVNHSIAQAGRDSKTPDLSVRDRILKVTGKYYRYFSGLDDFVQVVVWRTAADLDGLFAADCWNRIFKCCRCQKFFVAKTRRFQKFCSKKCRDTHRNRKEYMRMYMRDRRRRQLNP